MKKCIFSAVMMVMLAAALPALAHTPKGGLGDAAMSPDGKILVVGGDTRVLYILDPQTYQVKERVYLQTNIYEMEFNKDGSILVVEDVKENLYLIETGTWKVKTVLKDSGNFSAVPQLDLVACLQSGYKKSTIELRSMSDGGSKGRIEYPGSVTLIGLNAKGDRLVAMAKGEKGLEEKKPTPKDLKGDEKDLFQQQNDGEVSIITEFEAPSGKQLNQQISFYRPSNPKAMLVGDQGTFIVAYNNINAQWADNKTSLFKSGNSYNYGAGVSHDRKTFVSGGLAGGAHVQVEGMKTTEFKIPSLPGWPEYFEGFGFGPDGTAYGVTTAYRLVVIDNQGQVKKVVPVY